MCVCACNSKLGSKHVLNCMDRNEIEGLFEEAIESWPKWVWTHDHWIQRHIYI